jgi:hypothetical protein
VLPAPASEAELFIVFSNQVCGQCGGQFVIHKNEPMTRSAYLQGKPVAEKNPNNA